MDALPLGSHSSLHFLLKVHHAEWESFISAFIFSTNHELGGHVPPLLYPYCLAQDLSYSEGRTNAFERRPESEGIEPNLKSYLSHAKPWEGFLSHWRPTRSWEHFGTERDNRVWSYLSGRSRPKRAEQFGLAWPSLSQTSANWWEGLLSPSLPLIPAPLPEPWCSVH